MPMKKFIAPIVCFGFMACSAPEQKAEISEDQAVQTINENLNAAEEEVKEIKKDIDKSLDEALKKVENENK